MKKIKDEHLVWKNSQSIRIARTKVEGTYKMIHILFGASIV